MVGCSPRTRWTKVYSRNSRHMQRNKGFSGNTFVESCFLLMATKSAVTHLWQLQGLRLIFVDAMREKRMDSRNTSSITRDFGACCVTGLQGHQRWDIMSSINNFHIFYGLWGYVYYLMVITPNPNKILMKIMGHLFNLLLVFSCNRVNRDPPNKRQKKKSGSRDDYKIRKTFTFKSLVWAVISIQVFSLLVLDL